MSRNTHRTITIGSALALAALLGAATSSARPAPTEYFKGPPWVSIEYPVNPYDATMRGAVLLVHEFHHATQVAGAVEGTAEGLVGGTRRSVALHFDTTSRMGVFALRKQWPSEGTWSLLIKVYQGHGDGATAVVDIGAAGEVTSVRVPTKRQDQWDIPQQVSAHEIDSTLTARAARSMSRR
ncbi:MAG: hypothetical protein M3081_07040 [Gemmatimonadota bacterium]|nr:hypothetical protein [Gemmatimonadota bacterium]